MINIQLLEEFKERAYLNAVRLFRDSALLFSNGRYPSALAIATASYEEIGKVHLIDRACDMMSLNPDGANELFEMYFKSPWTTNHLHKQVRAFADANNKLVATDDSLRSYIQSGGMENSRQQSLYVEMAKKKILTPSRITIEKSFEMIKLCFDAFQGTADLAFNGFTAAPTDKSEWLAKRALQEILESFEICLSHHENQALWESP